MANHNQFLFILTSLQIGDMQSYVSKLYLHVNHETKKLVFFVDNAPWNDKVTHSKSVELWQLMVTQSRKSPFANHCHRFESRGPFNRELSNEANSRGKDENLNSDNSEGFTKRTLRQRLFQKDQGQLVKFLSSFFHRKLFQNQSQVGKFFDDFFQHQLSMQEVSHLLYGCITFETEWNNVRGINYVNELLTDTSVALEVKLMVKREFCEFDGALTFHGVNAAEYALSSLSRHSPLTKEVEKTTVIHPDGDPLLSTLHSTELSSTCIQGWDDAEDYFSPQCDSDSDCELLDAVCYVDGRTFPEKMSCIWDVISDADDEPITNVSLVFSDTGECNSDCHSFASTSMDAEIMFAVESTEPDSLDGSDFSDNESSTCSSQDDHIPTVYKDLLILFRFNDPILPLHLKKIITEDQRLLKMLESGLPSWALFLQSYPGVSKLYRPWMSPLARTMYVLVSLITVIIGFYDLYKNVPILKATAARLCGPLFEWIEDWEMISRIKYLGTVLFLQNWEKAFRWVLLVVRTARRMSAIIMKPMMEPLEEFAELIWLPVWNILFGSLWGAINLIWMTVSSVLEYTIDILQFIIWPFVALVTALWKLVTMIIFTMWSLITLPFYLIIILLDILIAIVLRISKFVQNIWILCTQLLYVVGPQAGSAKSSASTWRVLWNDIFSQVFRAIRSIINVLVAFFTSCNRHRLSIYNHTTAFIFRFTYLMKGGYSRVANMYRHSVHTPFVALDGIDDQNVDKQDSESSTVEFIPRNKDIGTSTVHKRNSRRNRRLSQRS